MGNRFSTVCFYAIFFFLLSGCGKIEVIQSNGPAREKLDIAIVPSHHYGESPGSNPNWISDAQIIKEKLQRYPLLNRHWSKINLYRYDVAIFDDYHDGTFQPDQSRVKEFVSTLLPLFDFAQNDQVIFVTHSPGFRSLPGASAAPSPTRGDPNFLQIESDRLRVLIHEFGHSFGRLGDEYPKRYSRDVVAQEANIASSHAGNMCQDKWGDLFDVVVETETGSWVDDVVSARTVGCFNGLQEGSPGSRFTPTRAGCIMDQISEDFPFCPVCERHLETLFSRYAE